MGQQYNLLNKNRVAEMSNELNSDRSKLNVEQ